MELISGMDGVSQLVHLSGAALSLLPAPQTILCDAAGSAAPETCPPPLQATSPSALSRGWGGPRHPHDTQLQRTQSKHRIIFLCNYHPIFFSEK